MNLSLPLTPAEEAKLLARARDQGVTPENLIRKAIEPIITAGEQVSPAKKPTKSALGALAHLGRAPSAEEIDENRVEMFANFGRDDVA